MKLRILIVAFLTMMLSEANAQTSVWNGELQKYVSNSGNVDYKSWKKSPQKLDVYITYLTKTSPNNWSADKEKAFWINAYNAYTVKLILDNYPLNSITEIKENGKNAWEIPFAKVGGKTYTLNQIEHEILRKKFDDPRIHVGVNCASYSCPQLANYAFTEKNVNSSLEKLMKLFINDSKRNRIATNKAQLSEIFNWFKGDFTKNGTLVDYINKYSNTKLNSNASISYLQYNWNLNGK
ncbi:DUF547 domain-containing protein [Aureivirga marina]|uniref:DUF547 domain-containing protein n=1 Tax=Aureivirga marina TaxID=1182451 RepID=UPI0018CBA5E4|nr:DUF547 domain-containing protein [Aureivirga marina]